MAEPAWEKLFTDDGDEYYYNRTEGITTWDRPEGFIEAAGGSGAASEGGAGHGRGGAGGGAGAPHGAGSEEGGGGADVHPGVAGAGGSGGSAGREEGAPKWVKMRTASYGMGEGDDAADCYYVNQETGATTWDRPDGYVESDDDGAGRQRDALGDDERGEWEVDPDAPLDETLARLALYSELAEDQRTAMVAGEPGAGAGPHRRLRLLLELVQTTGSEEEWDAVLCADDFQLPHYLYCHWSANSPPAVQLTVCRLFVLVGKLRPEVMARLVDGTWGTAGETLMTARQGFLEASSAKDDEGLRVWMLLLSEMLAETMEQDSPLPRESLPDYAGFVSPLFDLMDDATEEVFLATAHAVLALNVHYSHWERVDQDAGKPLPAAGEPRPNAVMAALLQHDKAEFFGEALLHIVNNQHYPYRNETVLRQSLQFLETMFEGEGDGNTAAFLYTNDLKVLVDIIIREVQDLPPPDTVRRGYLKVAHLLIRNSPWMEHGRYRREDLLSALEGVLDAGQKGENMDPESCRLVEDIFVDCISILE